MQYQCKNLIGWHGPGSNWYTLTDSYVTPEVKALLNKPGVREIKVKFADGSRKFRVKSA